MEFTIPQKEENPVCVECLALTPDKYHSCMQACSHLVSWCSHEARKAVNLAAQRSANSIKLLNEQREALRND